MVRSGGIGGLSEEEEESSLETRLQGVGGRAAEEASHLREEGRVPLGVPDELEEIDAVGLETREDSLQGFVAGDSVLLSKFCHAVLLPSSPSGFQTFRILGGEDAARFIKTTVFGAGARERPKLRGEIRPWLLGRALVRV